MDTYLTLLYVTLEQETAVKDFFLENGWTYCKPDLTVMTDIVGPADQQFFKTKTGKIITYVQHSDSDAIPKTKSTKLVTRTREKKGLNSQDVADIKVEAVSEMHDFPDHVDTVESGPIENDDGDNDDDYADSLDMTAEEGENEKDSTESTETSKKRGRKSFSKSPKPIRKSGRGRCAVDATPGSGTADRGEPTASGRKRRKVTVETEANIGAVLSEEQVEDEKKAESPLYDKQYLRDLLTEALRSSPSGKESAKTEFSVCPHCEKIVRNPNMRRHLLSHLDLPFRCTRCTVFFKTEADLEVHKSEKHVGEFVCSFCGVKYRFRNSLSEHIQIKHEGSVKLYECPTCGIRMIRKSHLEDHMNTHSDINPYSCLTCHKTYKNKSAYKRHAKDCGMGIKYTCNVCGQLYKSGTGLRDHTRRCHDEFLLYCACGNSFKTRSARCRHRVHCESFIKEQEMKGTSKPEINPLLTISVISAKVTVTSKKESNKEKQVDDDEQLHNSENIDNDIQVDNHD